MVLGRFQNPLRCESHHVTVTVTAVTACHFSLEEEEEEEEEEEMQKHDEGIHLRVLLACLPACLEL